MDSKRTIEARQKGEAARRARVQGAALMVEAVAEFRTGMEARVFMDRHAFMSGLECLT